MFPRLQFKHRSHATLLSTLSALPRHVSVRVPIPFRTRRHTKTMMYTLISYRRSSGMKWGGFQDSDARVDVVFSQGRNPSFPRHTEVDDAVRRTPAFKFFLVKPEKVTHVVNQRAHSGNQFICLQMYLSYLLYHSSG